MPDALSLTGVSKVYEVGGTELVALHQVDLAVAAHEVVTLVGPSGSGKTTLLAIAGGLLSASTGRVVVGGEDITRARGRRLTRFRRRRVGFIFQSVNLVPFLTARENLVLMGELSPSGRRPARRRADQLLEELGLADRRDNLPAQLSGGERQRVAIGRALMNEPGLVLVDEPTSALDSSLGEQVMQLIVSEVRARGAAAIIVTHDSRMTRFGDRILNMADGRIVGMTPQPEWTVPQPVADEAATLFAEPAPTAPWWEGAEPVVPGLMPEGDPWPEPTSASGPPTEPIWPSSWWGMPPHRRPPGRAASGRPPRAGQRPSRPPRPATGQYRPVTGQHRPVTGETRPVTGPNRPVTGQTRPVTGPNRPVTGSNRPIAGPPRPATGQYRQVTGEHRPATGQDHLVTGEDDPGADGVPPVSQVPWEVPRSRPIPGGRRFPPPPRGYRPPRRD